MYKEIKGSIVDKFYECNQKNTLPYLRFYVQFKGLWEAPLHTRLPPIFSRQKNQNFDALTAFF